jgi:hypothetical protein
MVKKLNCGIKGVKVKFFAVKPLMSDLHYIAVKYTGHNGMAGQCEVNQLPSDNGTTTFLIMNKSVMGGLWDSTG